MKRFASLAIIGALAAALLAATPPAGGAAATATLPTINLGLTGSSITVAGTLQSGAVNVVSSTSREVAGEPTLLWLKPGATFQQAFGAVAAHHGDPNYLDPYGAIVFVATAPKGISSAQTVLQPGTYVALDTTKDNPAKWPHTEFTVSQSAAPAALPGARSTVKAIEFGFKGAAALRNGSTVRFENDGFLAHDITAVRVKNARDAKALTALLVAGKDNKAEKLATGFSQFAGPLSPGAVQQFTLHAKPGVYVLACFLDTQDGREQTRLGMERTVRIVK